MSNRPYYRTLLENLMKKKTEIYAAAIVLRNGLIVDSKIREHLENDEIIGAITAVFDNFIKRVQKEFGSSEKFTNLINVDKFKFYLASAGNIAIITIVTAIDAADDWLNYYGSIFAEKVESVLAEHPTDLSIPNYEDSTESLPKGHYTLKIVIIGSPGVGKTSLISQFVGKGMPSEYLPTVNVDISEKKIVLAQDCDILINVWDLQSQLQQTSNLRRRFFNDTDLILILFDLSRRDSFDKIEYWINNAKTIYSKRVPLILVGNKLDLLNVQVSDKEIQEKATKLGCKFVKCSAKENINVTEVFRVASMEYLRIKERS